MPDTNPISYTSRDYDSIITDINSDADLAAKPSWWKRIWAGVGDVISMWLNAQANNNFLQTAFTRASVKDLVELIDYTLSPHSTSSGVVLFYVKTSLGSGIYPFTIQEEDLTARSVGTLSSASKIFEARANENFTDVNDTFTTNFAVNNELTLGTDLLYTGHKVRLTTTNTLPTPLTTGVDYYAIYLTSTTIKLAATLEDAYAGNEIALSDDGVGVHTLTLFSKAVTLYQQETLQSSVIIGASDGIAEWQEFILPDSFVLQDTLTITVNAIGWTRVDTLVDSLSTDKHYKIIPKSENQLAVRFGNGTYGKIPEAFDVEAVYSYGGGSDSNIPTVNRISVYGGSDSNATGVSNPAALTGGGDEESLASAKNLAPLLLKARNRFVTVGDGEALVLAVGGVSTVKINKNVFGVLSCQVVGIADGGGDVSGALRTTIQQFLIDRTILESIDARFEASTITATAVTSAAKMLPGFLFANVSPFFELAYQLFLSEAGQEIQDKFVADGIADTVTLINTIFSASFDENDYNQIARLVDPDNFTPRQFGGTIQQSDVFGYVDTFVIGIDYITIAVFGGGFPLALAANEITTPGALALTEI